MSALRNPRHEQFARLVAAGESPSKAYTLVGYSDSNAASCSSRLFVNGKVRSRIVELQEESARSAIKKNELDRDWVLSRLKENAERALKAVPVTDAEGNPSGEWRWEGAVANRALELIGKELGMFVDRTDVKVQADVSERALSLATVLSPAELLDLQRKLAAAQAQKLLQAPEVVDVKAIPSEEKEK